MCAARSRWCGPTRALCLPTLVSAALLAVVPGLARAADPPAGPTANASGARRDPGETRKPKGPPDGRAFALGVEGSIITTPPLRSRVVYVDPRFVGRSTALGGLGVFGRYRPLSFIGFDANIRTGSLRLRAEEGDTTISTDQVLADIGTLLYLGRGEVSQFAFSGGIGGLVHRIRYDLDSGIRGTQSFGAFTMRVGAEAEFLVNRIAFVLSFRTYGVVTPRSHARTSGDLFKGRSDEDKAAPVASFSTYLAGSAGIAYRF